jgi:hypothetical protein
MGTLVFQATLGGAVNIIGPNIANTINFTLPSADGTSGQTWTTNGSGVLAFGTLGIAGGGTGQITATAAFNALAPNQSGQSGKYLTTDGTNTSWGTNPLGTVTSVGGTGTVNGITLTGTVTSSGNLTLGGTLSGVSLTSQVTGTLPTANGGTNLTSFTSGGVVYASSSSALATGSALTFDGTKLQLTGTAATNTTSIGLGGSTTGYQRMLINNTSGGGQFGIEGSTASTITTGSSAYATVVGDYAGYPLHLITGNVVRATIDTSGNLGLGVTPSAWSLIKGLQVSGNGMFGAYNNESYVANNWVYDGAEKYIANGFSTRYTQSSGKHIWYNAPSNASGAGAALTFTQAMTLDASNNLFLGGTTSSYTASNRTVLAINGTTSSFLSLQSGGTDRFYAITTSSQTDLGTLTAIPLTFNTNATERARIVSTGEFLINTSTSRSNFYANSALLQVERATDRSRGMFTSNINGVGGSELILVKSRGTSLNSNTIVQNGDELGNLYFSGTDGTNIIIGAGIRGEVDGTPGTNDMPGRLLFLTTADGASSATERARIDSSGNLLVGTSTSGNSRLYVVGASTTSSDIAIRVRDSSAVDMFYVRNDGLICTGARTSSPYNFTTASAANMFVDSSGFLYRSTSSLKYKTDVQDTTHGLEKVMALRPVTYKGKNDGDTVFGGLIAEEVHAAGLTEFVQYADDGTPDALAYGNMVSLAFKAIQEQQAMIESLRQRLSAANL